MDRILHALRRITVPVARLLAVRVGRRYFYYLAVLLIVFAAADVFFLHRIGGMQSATFDMLMKVRLNHPKPDPDIVIVDIDEASLADMAEDFGRWPWPRQVLGEMLERVAAQQPRAIAFDILFSDPDVYNPDSDAAFDDAIAAHPGAYFATLRLPPENDRLSQIPVSRVPGVVRTDPAAADHTIALVLPNFAAALAHGHLGYSNLEPDADGVLRHYVVARDEGGWRLPSLPYAVALGTGSCRHCPDSILVNWRGKPGTYARVSFAKIFRDMLKKHPTRPANEFAGKIVIIGSTAPALFDIKPTPVATLHPGVEILATTIDNLRRGDYLRTLDPWWYFGVSVIFLGLLAAAFVNRVPVAVINRGFVAAQMIMVGVSFVALSVSTWHVDLTMPITLGLIYFALAKVQLFFADGRLSGRPLFREEPMAGKPYAVRFMVIAWNCATPRLLKMMAVRTRNLVSSAEGGAYCAQEILDKFGALGRSLGGVTLIYWLWRVDDAAEATREAADAERVAAGLPTLATPARYAGCKLECKVTEHDLGIWQDGVSLAGLRGALADSLRGAWQSSREEP